MNWDRRRDLIAIVIPCFNEERRLAPSRFREFLNDNQAFRLLFVDDGSSDETHAVLESIRQSLYSQVDVVRLNSNYGKAEAVRAGALHALSHEQWQHRIEFVGFFDADMATPLSELKRMVEVGQRRGDIDLIVGSRMALAGHRVERSPIRRKIGRLFASSASWLFSLGLRDTQCGAKLFRNVPSLTAALESPFTDRWLFDVELLTRLRLELGSEFAERILEMPLESWQEVPGSKLKPTDFARAPLRLLKLFAKYRLFASSATTRSVEPHQAPVTYRIEEHREPVVAVRSQKKRKAA